MSSLPGPTSAPAPAKPIALRIVVILLCAYYGGWCAWLVWDFFQAARVPYFDPGTIPLYVAKAVIPLGIAWLYAIGYRLMGLLTWGLLSLLSFLTCLAYLILWREPGEFLQALVFQVVPFLLTLYGLSEAFRWNRLHPAAGTALGSGGLGFVPEGRRLVWNLGCGAAVLGALGLIAALSLSRAKPSGPAGQGEAQVRLHFETSWVKVAVGKTFPFRVKTAPELPAPDLSFAVEEGPSGGAVNDQGLYTAPARPGVFHVAVASRSHPSLKDRCTVEVRELLWELAPVQDLFTPSWPGLPVPLDDNTALYLPVAAVANLEDRPWLLNLTWGSETTFNVPVGLLQAGTAIPLGRGRVLATRTWGPGLAATGATCLIDVNLITFTQCPGVTPRDHGSATRLDDGRVFLGGGDDQAKPGDAAEILEGEHGAVVRYTHLLFARSHHTATRMQTGGVLVAGGQGPGGNTLRTCEILSDQTLDSTEACTLVEARCDHTATLLCDGRILICGGLDAWGMVTGDLEVCDAAGKLSSPVGSLQIPRSGQKAILLKDGSVLVAGGWNAKGLPVTTLEIIDTGTWRSQVLPFPGAAGDEVVTALRLPSGEVYVLCRNEARPVYNLR